MSWGILVIGAVVAFVIIIVVGLICVAGDGVFDEQDCRATVDRSNGLSEEREDV